MHKMRVKEQYIGVLFSHMLANIAKIECSQIKDSLQYMFLYYLLCPVLSIFNFNLCFNSLLKPRQWDI